MRLKVRPEDFLVEELFDPAGLGTEGEHDYYRVRKRGLTTLQAVSRLARAAGVRTDAIRFAGFKDRQAVTVQWMSVAGGRLAELGEPGLEATFAGRAAGPLDPGAVAGNRFRIRLRDLEPAGAAGLAAETAAVRDHGLPNFFDEQRFGALRAGLSFPFREILRGRPDEALRLLLATPARHDPPAAAAAKARLAEVWGEWAECARRAGSGPAARAFGLLARDPKEWRGAFQAVPRRERLIQAFAWQAWVWNQTLARLLQERFGPDRLLSIPWEGGSWPAWRTLEPAEREWLEGLGLPLPDHRSRPARPEAAAALAAVFAAEGVEQAALRVKGVRGLELREEPREARLRPRLLEADPPEADDLFPGRMTLVLRLELPRGAYATLVARRLMAGTGGGGRDE